MFAYVIRRNVYSIYSQTKYVSGKHYDNDNDLTNKLAEYGMVELVGRTRELWRQLYITSCRYTNAVDSAEGYRAKCMYVAMHYMFLSEM